MTSLLVFHSVRGVGSVFIPDLQVLAPHRAESASDLLISVVYTDSDETKAALKSAAGLSAGLNADIDLIVPHVVPFPLPLVRPSVPPGFTLQRLLDLAAAADVQPSIFVYLCRDALETLLQVLNLHSVIIIGSKKRWLPAKPERLAKALRKNGHHVILARHP